MRASILTHAQVKFKEIIVSFAPSTLRKLSRYFVYILQKAPRRTMECPSHESERADESRVFKTHAQRRKNPTKPQIYALNKLTITTLQKDAGLFRHKIPTKANQKPQRRQNSQPDQFLYEILVNTSPLHDQFLVENRYAFPTYLCLPTYKLRQPSTSALLSAQSSANRPTSRLFMPQRAFHTPHFVSRSRQQAHRHHHLPSNSCHQTSSQSPH